MYIDTHSHVTFEQFDDDREEVLKRALDSGVEHIIAIGAGAGVEEGNRAAIELARSHDYVSATVGIHPHDASRFGPKELRILKELAEDPAVVAWGEIGLDFHYDKASRGDQRAAFTAQLKAARELELPVIIHSRDAPLSTLEIMKINFKEGWKRLSGVMHCYSGDVELAKEYVNLGFLISIPGVITFKNASTLRRVVEELPVEVMVIETDCPFLTPVPYRGKRNEPAYVKYVAEQIARLKGLTPEDVGRITTLNARDLFRLRGAGRSPKISYRIRKNLYLNITNRCTNKCCFCPKFSTYTVKGHYLKLQEEPTVAEIIEEIGDPSQYEEVVFVGFGEPLLRLEEVKAVAKYLKSKGVKVRIDTDGLANAVHGRNVALELKGLIDAISVSLNASDAETYQRLCRSSLGSDAYDEVKKFILEVKKHIPEVTATMVGIPKLDVEAVRRIAEDELGVSFRVREYNEVG